MTELLLPAALVPALLALALLVPAKAVRTIVLWLAPWGALPALILSLTARTGESVAYPWLLLGTRVGLDDLGRLLLFLTAAVWTLVGPYARSYLTDTVGETRFWIFFLLTMSGNLLLVVAQDLATFYLGFALMTFAAFGLVVHDRTPAAARAGRVYIALAVLGEALILAGLLLVGGASGTLALDRVGAAIAGSGQRDLTMLLLFAGFGVKAGALPFHVWLPLAYTAAPMPASAALSGATINAGLLGWLRFLPLGSVALPAWGEAVVALGLAAAFYGVAVGVPQRDPKTILAYSSISQMGLMTVGVGVGLAEPAALPLATTAVVFFAVHHGFAKAALFLGLGVVDAAHTGIRRWFAIAGLAFAALALAAAPLTSGAAAKGALTGLAAVAPARWELWLGEILTLTSVATSLLMARFLVLVGQRRPADAGRAGFGLWGPWLFLLAVLGMVAWIIPARFALDGIRVTPLNPTYLLAAVWPILAGAIGLGALLALSRRWTRRPPVLVPPGDVLVLAEWGLNAAAAGRDRLRPLATVTGRFAATIADHRAGSAAEATLRRGESMLAHFSPASLLVLIGIVVFAVALAWR